MAGVRRIGLVLCPDFDFMGLAVTSPFAVANRYVADTTYDIHVLSEAGGLLRSGSGPAVETEPLSEPSAFDTIIVAAGISLPEPSPSPPRSRRLPAGGGPFHAAPGGPVLGAFALADAGLLSGRSRHDPMRYAPQFRARYPNCASTLTRYTSRTATSGLPRHVGGIDLAVAMVERDHGRQVARTVARGLVMERRRAGGQAQHSALLDFDAPSDRIQSVLAYARQNLRRPLTTEDLAAVACLSPRQFTRAFRTETGVSPAKAVEAMRVEAAKHMLEQSRLPIEQIAAAAGFANREGCAGHSCVSRATSRGRSAGLRVRSPSSDAAACPKTRQI